VIEIFANAPFRESAIPLKLPRPSGEELFCRFGSSQELGAPAAVVFEHGFARSATVPAWWSPLQETISRWSEHKDARLGAALAYYSIFSVGPLIVIAIAIAGLVFGAEAVQAQVFGALHSLLGDSGTQAIDAMLKGANRPREGILATVIGVATLVFAAVGVVVQLKDALNTVWEVTQPGSGIWRFLRTYIWSLAGVLSLGFLLLVSMLLTAGLSAAGKYISPYLPEAALQIAGFLVSFVVIAVLFAMMFKWLPDAPIAWRDVGLGAILTAALFEVGKFLIGLYIGKQGLESTYGAAASIVVVLIWVYYCAQLVLMGAEFTNVYARRYGSQRNVASADRRPTEPKPADAGRVRAA
jgi:membrane protein